MVVPANRVVALSIVSADVAHSWWIPALGGKIDAIPGRTNHSWFKADENATYDGQCAELCGVQHAYMKAHVQAVSAANYAAWTAQRRRRTAVPNAQLGGEEVGAVCAKCHNLAATGRSSSARTSAGTRCSSRGTASRSSSRNGVGQMPAGREGLERRGDQLARLVLQAGSAQGRRRQWRLGPSPSDAELVRGPLRELADHGRPQADRDPLHLRRAWSSSAPAASSRC